MAANIFMVGPWQYFCKKYNAENEVRPVYCPMGRDLVRYLARRKGDRERFQSMPLRRRGDLEWCRQREDLNQKIIYEVLRTGLSKERRGDGVPFTASPAVGIKNLHVMLIGKPLTFYLAVICY
jgi:hypothetical protein